MSQLIRVVPALAALLACALFSSCAQTGSKLGNGNDTPPIGMPVPTQMGAPLAAAGLQVANLPSLAALTKAQRETIMTTFTESLGVDCAGCHTANYATETPNIRVTRKMWDRFARAMTLSNGQALYCDSCHQGKSDFLSAQSPAQIEDLMQRGYVGGLTRLDATPRSCAGCHGDPYIEGLVKAWGAEPGLPTDPMDAGTMFTDGSVVPGANDLSTTPADGAVAPTCTVLLNELQVAGTGGATDEFIELFNPCADPIVLDGYTLVYRSSAGASDLSVVALGTRTLAKNSYLVAANSGFAGAKDLSYTRALAATGGGIALRDSLGAIVDVISYGDATNTFVRGTPAPAPTTGKSLGRVPNGAVGVGNHSLDFQMITPTPGAAN